jgi:hypothetical protein
VNKITFYEQVGIVIPGSVFMFGLLLFFPALQTVLTKDSVNLGDFGIFLLLSYAAGHLIAAIGNAAENVLWPLVGGMPTNWITRTDATLLSTPQIDLLEKKLESRLGITEKVRGLDPKLWWPIRMDARRPRLDPPHVQPAGRKLDLIPLQVAQLEGPQAVAIADQDHSRRPALCDLGACRHGQRSDFSGRRVPTFDPHPFSRIRLLRVAARP